MHAVLTCFIIYVTVDTPPSVNCSNGEFPCSTGDQCILASFVCDNETNCEDGSDEVNCTVHCSEFTCTNGECILNSQVCNGTQDCTDGSDEMGCPKNCSEVEFSCFSGNECISMSQVCNNEANCEDGSDEEVCGKSLISGY